MVKASRKWQITINNPLEKGASREKVKKIISAHSGVVYFAMVEEVGKEGTHHIHIFLVTKSPSQFSMWRKAFDEKAHIENARGSIKDNVAYLKKEGKWKDTEKAETTVQGSFEEVGERPEEKGQGFRSDIALMIELVEQGMSNAELMRTIPEIYVRNINTVEKIRTTILKEQFSPVFRKMEVTYIFGTTGTGKTRGVMEKHGYNNVYRVVNPRNPFDMYEQQDVIVFEEFLSTQNPIQQMLLYTDGYCCALPSRYYDKIAVYTKVYLLSNLSLRYQYEDIQGENYETYRALLRRINAVFEYKRDGKIIEHGTGEQFMAQFDKFESLPKEEKNPFCSK